MLKRVTVVSAIVALALLATSAHACSEPVFQNAMNQWPPDVYRVVIFHKGALGAGDAAVVAGLKNASRTANIEVRTADVDQALPPNLAGLYKKLSPQSLPWMVLLFPGPLDGAAAAPEDVLWSGPLDKAAAEGLVDSPKRREIARRLLDGDAVVWVLLESGDKAADEALATVTSKELEGLQKPLSESLARRLAEGIGDGASPESPQAPTPAIKVVFSVLRISPKDPDEQFLIRLLKAMYPPQHADSGKPALFPVFGRGRVLDALVGSRLDKDAIEAAAAFLTGECACTVKALNPGTDLLIAVDWDARAPGQSIASKPAPSLTGVMPDGPRASMPAQKSAGNAGQASAGPSPVLLASLGALALGVVAVAAVGLLLRRRASRREGAAK